MYGCSGEARPGVRGDATVIINRRGVLYQGGIGGGKGRWSNSGYIFKAELKKFADGTIVEFRSKRKVN